MAEREAASVMNIDKGDRSMDVTLTADQLPEAMRRVRQWNLGGTSYMTEDCLRVEISQSMGMDVAVDKWPDFSIILLIFGPNFEYEYMADMIIFVAQDGVDIRKYLVEAKQLKGRNFAANFPMKYEPIYKEIFDQLKAQPLFSLVLHLLGTDLKSLKPRTLDDSYTTCELQESDAELVDSLWEFRNDKSIEFVRFCIRNFPTVAVKTKDGVLVAWELTYYFGAMGMLYVIKEHRGRGLAKFIIYKLARKLLDQGWNAYCFVESQNKASVELHIKCGFSVLEGHDLYHARIKQI